MEIELVMANSLIRTILTLLPSPWAFSFVCYPYPSSAHVAQYRRTGLVERSSMETIINSMFYDVFHSIDCKNELNLLFGFFGDTLDVHCDPQLHLEF